MLRGIRKASANWLGRAVMGVVMGLLAASFAVWGINDIFRGFGRSTLAKIGGTEIAIDQFRRTYNERLQRFGNQVGHPLSPEEAAQIGLDRQVLSEMIMDAGLDQRARQMRLGISDAEVVRRITADPVFHERRRQLSTRRGSRIVLRNAGYSEQRFVAEQRRLMLRRQIVDSLSGACQCRKHGSTRSTGIENEERSIEYVPLGPAQAGEIPQPTADELNKYFEARKIMFQAPEYRKIVTVDGTPAGARQVDRSIRRRRQTRLRRAPQPLRQRRSSRHVQQIVFPTMAGGGGRRRAAQGRPELSPRSLPSAVSRIRTLDLGMATKSELIDPAVADAAFALKEGEVSAPVRGRFGAAVVTVTKIEPAEDKPLAELAPQDPQGRRRANAPRPTYGDCTTRSRTRAPAAAR